MSIWKPEGEGDIGFGMAVWRDWCRQEITRRLTERGRTPEQIEEDLENIDVVRPFIEGLSASQRPVNVKDLPGKITITPIEPMGEA